MTTDERPPSSSHTAAEPSPAPSGKTVSTSAEKVQEPPPPWWKFWQGNPESVLARATVFLAIATILLAAIAAIQAYILATTDASTRIVAEAAQSAASTAKSTLEASALSFRQEQRPYLWASSFNMDSPPVCQFADGTHICGDVHIVNSGRTPAIGVKINRYATFGASAESVVKAMKIPPYPSPTSDMLGGVGDKWGTAITEVVDEATAKEIVAGFRYFW
jgi:hypothetical protein